MEAIWGLIGTLIGALASIGTTWITARNASTLQIAIAERARDEQNRTFQRETLLELQMAVSDILRLVSRAHFQGRMAFRSGTAWGRNMIDDALDAEMGTTFRKVSLLTARVVDDQLRQEVQQAVASAARVSAAVDEHSAIAQVTIAMNAGTALMERIDINLRQQY
ncbi:hypothetical protein [Janthinobacterium sp. 75]|uniref:hypothetical protein n=1 Tax=Janthinobacterium sp. 75 TaxID=2135628 RepID=UPI0010633507|nr:hypothetical protein [Janthinobacterium sp. 75]